MVLRVSRLLEFLEPWREVSVRVVGVTRRLPDRVRARGQTVIRVTQLDQVVVQVGAVLRPRALRVAEAEAVVHRRRALRVMEVVRAVDVADLVVVPLEVHRFLQGRQDPQMTLRISLTERCSKSLRINVVRSVFSRRCSSRSSG